MTTRPTHCTVRRFGVMWNWTVHIHVDGGIGLETSGAAFTKWGAKWAANRAFRRELRWAKPQPEEMWAP